ncbi:hypothetical protein D3C87_1723060 [compost metagenome]
MTHVRQNMKREPLIIMRINILRYLFYPVFVGQGLTRGLASFAGAIISLNCLLGRLEYANILAAGLSGFAGRPAKNPRSLDRIQELMIIRGVVRNNSLPIFVFHRLRLLLTLDG